MRVVIDTNVMFSSFFGGNALKIIDLWKSGHVTLCISAEIIDEYYQTILLDPLTKENASLFFSVFAKQSNILFTNTTRRISVVTDPDDNKFIECAEALNASHVISGDRALLAVKRYGNIKIVTPKNFLDERKNANS